MNSIELWILVIWAAFAWWGGKLAYNKGNSAFGGALAGLLLGPFGILLVAVYPSNRRKIWERERDWEAERADWESAQAAPPAPRPTSPKTNARYRRVR